MCQRGHQHKHNKLHPEFVAPPPCTTRPPRALFGSRGQSLLHVKNLANRVLGGEELHPGLFQTSHVELGETRPACNQEAQLTACVARFQSAGQYHSLGSF